MSPSGPTPVDFAALKEILAIWKIMGALMPIPSLGGALLAWIGHVRGRFELIAIGLGIEFSLSMVAMVLFGILLFQISRWHDRHVKPEAESERAKGGASAPG